MNKVKTEDFLGRTLTKVENRDGRELFLTFDNGEVFRYYHEHECSEGVSIDDVIGDLYDLLNSPLTLAEESTSNDERFSKSYYHSSTTWTFYRFATVYGYVTIRWYGQSNGYYSESVTLERFNPDNYTGPDNHTTSDDEWYENERA